MNTLSPPRSAASPSALAKPARTPLIPAPHIFQPISGEPPRQRATLFQFKTKPGYYNAAERAALLRREKQPPHDELFIDFAGPQVQVELVVRGEALFSGPWGHHTAISGQALSAAGEWSEVCWHREDLCDYLEIELPLTGGWRLERHMLLARQDRFLFLADALLGPGESPAEIAHCQGLPLADRVSSQGARETREMTISRLGRSYASAVPLALGEWRAEHCHAELCEDAGRLTLRQAAQGRSLFAPLWFDLDPRRLKRPITWRRLSVGENLAIVPRDIAAGYRVQAGEEQWLIYRSLTPRGNRSVLGHNTAYSFICGRIKKNGNFDPIIEIE